MALFKTSEECEKLLITLRRRSHGILANVWCRIGFGLSLSMNDLPNVDYDSQGKEFSDDMFWGKHGQVLLALLRQRHAPDVVDKENVGKLIKMHVERGVRLLDQQLTKVNQKTDELLTRLVKHAISNISDGDTSSNIIVDKDLGFVLSLGKQVPGGSEIKSDLNQEGTSPHVAIMGRSGSGKTRMALRLLSDIKQKKENFPLLIFDYSKGDIAGNLDFVKKTKSIVIRADKPNSIPIAPLALEEDHDDVDIKNAARRFQDTILSVVHLGPKQKQRLLDIMEDIYRIYGCSPTLEQLVDSIMTFYEQQGLPDDSLTSTLRNLADFPLFKQDNGIKDCPFWTENHIIDLHRLPEGTRKLAVFLILDALHYKMMRMEDSLIDAKGNRELRLIIVIDEAHNYLPCKQPTLEKMVREVRSKGISIWLLSQSPDDFDQKDYNFAREMGVVICFACHIDRKKMLETMIGGKIKTEELISLETGLAIARVSGIKDTVRIRCWKPTREK